MTMTFEIITTEGISLDLLPNQDVEITFEQPLLNSDKMPIAGSTSIEFPLTPTNKRVFGCYCIPFTGVEHREIAAGIFLSGIPIWSGKLTAPEVLEETISWTFIGASLDPILEKNICDLPDLLIESTTPLLLDARKNERNDVGFPIIIRQTYVADCEYQQGEGVFTPTEANPAISNADCSPTEKYVNWGFVSAEHAATPVVKVMWLIEKFLPNVVIDNRISWLLDKCAILAPHARTYQRVDESGMYDSIKYCINVADGLPDITIADFLSNILKMFCASLYYNGEDCRIVANINILGRQDFVNWDEKISLPSKVVHNGGQSYKLSYANEEEVTETQDEGSLDIITASSIPDMVDTLSGCMSITNIKYPDSSNLYAGRCFKINPNYSYTGKGKTVKFEWQASPNENLVVLDCARHNDIKSRTINIDYADEEYDSSVKFKCVKCVPVHLVKGRDITETEELGQGISAIAPIIEMPAVDAERTTDVYIGLLEHGQWVDKGCVYKGQEWAEYGGWENYEGECSGEFGDESVGDITLWGEDSLWEKYHQQFAEWISRPKLSFTSDIKLTLSDLLNLDLTKQVFAYNKYFLIQELRVRLNTSWGLVQSEVDLIES